MDIGAYSWLCRVYGQRVQLKKKKTQFPLRSNMSSYVLNIQQLRHNVHAKTLPTALTFGSCHFFFQKLFIHPCTFG